MNSIVLALCFVGIAAAGEIRLLAQPQQYVVPHVYHSAPVVHQLVQPKTYLAVSQPKLALDPKKPIAIISMNSDSQYDGNFKYDFQAENGIMAETSGTIKQLGPEDQAQVMQGKFAYTAPDGTPIQSTWFADETGFHIEGAHLPTPPPIPEAIARSLEYLASLPPSKEDLKQ